MRGMLVCSYSLLRNVSNEQHTYKGFRFMIWGNTTPCVINQRAARAFTGRLTQGVPQEPRYPLLVYAWLELIRSTTAALKHNRILVCSPNRVTRVSVQSIQSAL